MKRWFKKAAGVLLAAALLPTCFVSAASPWPVHTLSGQGGRMYADGSYAQARFAEPTGLAVSASGALLVGDSGNNLIRALGDGRVSTLSGAVDKRDVYGLAEGGFRDGSLKAARFNAPSFLAVDGQGKIYVSDTGNNRIRLLTGARVSTLCGGEKSGYKEGSAALFNAPTGIAVDDGGNLFLCDTLNHVVRKVSPAGESTLLAGVPKKAGYRDAAAKDALFNEPVGIALGAEGEIYISDSGNQRIRVLKDGRVSTLCGGGSDRDADTGYYMGGFADGTGENARFHFPQGIRLAPDGSLLVADSVNHSIRAVNAAGSVTTVVGNRNAGFADGAYEAELNLPTDMIVEKGKLYIADSANSAVRVAVLPYGG